MKRHLSPAPAPAFRLSVEEEAILVDEQSEGLHEIAVGEGEIDRALDTNEVVDSTVATVQEIEAPGSMEQELVAAVADMAVAGTDAAPDDLLTMDKDGVVTEGIADTVMAKVKQLWEKIKEMLMKAYNFIKNFFVGRVKAVESAKTAQVENDTFIEEHKVQILLMGYTPTPEEIVKAVRMKPDHGPAGSDDAIEMGYTKEKALQVGVNKYIALGYTPEEAKEEAAKQLGYTPEQVKEKHQKPDQGPTGSDDAISLGHIKDKAKQIGHNKFPALGHDSSGDADAVASRKVAAKDADDAALAGSAAAAKAKYDKAVKDLQTAMEHHKFKFKGDSSMISTMSGVPKDFEKQLIDMLHYSQTSHKDISKIMRNLCYSFDDVMAKFESAKPEAAIPAFTDKFTKDFEVLMRSVGELKVNDDMRTGRTKGLMLGGFAIAAHDFTGEVKSSTAALRLAARAGLELHVGSTHKAPEVPLSVDTTHSSFGAAIKHWLDFASGNDVKNAENELNEYTQKFVKHMDRLVGVQNSVKGSMDGTDTYHLLQGLIDLCRGMNKMIVEFTTKHIRGGLQIVRAAQVYQQESNQERVRMFREAMIAA